MSVDIRKDDGLRILSLDGGDLSCVSQLKILEELMKRLEHDSGAGEAIRPCNYFHLITGVGASGVIALLLGVLGLSVNDTIAAFLRLCEQICLGEEVEAHVRSGKFVTAIKMLLCGIDISEETRLRGDLSRGGRCKISIPYLSAADMTRCRMLRSYDSGHASHNPTLIEAFRIAWADPGLFSSIRVGPELMQEELVSAVDGFNNPTPQAIEEAYRAFGKDQRVCFLLSLGTGSAATRSLNTDRGALGQMIARDTESITEQLKRRHSRLHIYFRLSVDRNLNFRSASQTIEQMVGDISSLTSSFLETHDASDVLDRCLRSSYQASHITMEGLYHTRASSSRSSRGLPPLSAFYVPREKPMKQIAAALRTRVPGSPAIGLVLGLSGTGKTQISLKYAYNHDDEYDHIIFVDASSSESLEKSLLTRIRLIDRQLNPTNAEEALELLLNPEGNLTRNWLIIMDNADNSVVNLQDFIPSCDHGCVLITSRNAALSDLNPDGLIAMDVMSRKEAIEALLFAALGRNTTSPRQSDEPITGPMQLSSYTKKDIEYAGTIVDELGCLPLAVIQAACYIKKQKCLYDYPTLLKTSRNKILRWPASVQRDTLKYAHSTYAAFDTTLNALSPRAVKFLGVISFVNFSDFPKALIPLAASLQFGYEPRDLLDRTSEYQLSIELLSEIFCPGGQWDQTELDALLEELQNYSIVSLVPVSTIVTLRFHPLLHGWANDRLSLSDRVLFRAAAVRLLVCGTDFDDDYLWPYLFPHVDLLPITSEELHVNDRAALTVILKVGQHHSKALEVWTRIHDSISAVYGEKHLRTTRAALGLADAHGNHDYDRMEQMEKRVLEIRKEIMGEDDLETMIAMSNLARTWKDLGKLSEAADLELKVLEVRRRVLGPRHRQVVDALRELAETYRQQENYPDAQRALAEALDMITLLVGKTHVATISVMEQQACYYAQGGDRGRAIALQQEIMGLWRSIRGEMHATSLDAMSKLATSYSEQGQNKEAEEIWRELYNWRRKTLGKDHKKTLAALSWLGRSVHDQGRYADAELLWKDLVVGNQNTFGDQPNVTLIAAELLARSVAKQGRHADAEEIWSDVVARMRRSFGEQHSRTLDALFSLGRSITLQERYAEAEILYKEALEGREKMLGGRHADTLDVKYWLSYSVTKQGRHGSAEKLWKDVADGDRIVYGDKHELTIRALNFLARSIYSQGRLAESEVLFREVVAIGREALGKHNRTTLESVAWLSHCLCDQKKYADAEGFWVDLVAANRVVYGDQDTRTLDSLVFLGHILHVLDRHAEAEEAYKEALAGMRSTLGGKDVDALNALCRMGVSVYAQGRYLEAVNLLREGVEGRVEKLGPLHVDTLGAQEWLSLAQTALADQLPQAASSRPMVSSKMVRQSTAIPPK